MTELAERMTTVVSLDGNLYDIVIQGMKFSLRVRPQDDEAGWQQSVDAMRMTEHEYIQAEGDN